MVSSRVLGALLNQFGNTYFLMCVHDPMEMHVEAKGQSLVSLLRHHLLVLTWASPSSTRLAGQ